MVAAIGEQILGPTDVSLSNWTVCPSSSCSVVLATHTARGSERGRLHPDPGGEPVEHRVRLQLDPGPRASLRLPLPARHGLQLCGVHVRGRQRLRPIVRQLRGRPGCLGHCQDVLHSASERGGEAALRGALPGAGFLDGGADDVTLATLGEVLLEPTLTTLGNFLVRSNSQSSMVGGFQLEGYAVTLSAFAWNIVRTYTLTPGRRYSFGCRYRLGTASNLVMYVSAADNNYVGVTGTFLGSHCCRLHAPPPARAAPPCPGGARSAEVAAAAALAYSAASWGSCVRDQ